MSISRALNKMPKRAMATQVTPTGTDNVMNRKDKHMEFGYEGPDRKDKYLNPLLTPPPRSPKSPEDFMNHRKLGHWKSMGYDWTNPVADKYYLHEAYAGFFFSAAFCLWIWMYGPDYKLKEWARREAFLRTYKREALGLPLIDKNVVDPERIVLPSEEELDEYNFKVTL